MPKSKDYYKVWVHKVWIHIERINEADDVGEPQDTGVALEEAEEARDRAIEAA